MQYVFSEKGICSEQWGVGQTPETGEFLRIFVLKVTLQSVRLLLTVSYCTEKIRAAGCTNCSTNNLVGEQLLLLPHGSHAYINNAGNTVLRHQPFNSARTTSCKGPLPTRLEQQRQDKIDDKVRIDLLHIIISDFAVSRFTDTKVANKMAR